MASIIAVSWTILVLVGAPLAGILSRRALTDRMRPRSVIYAGSAINLVLIGIVTAAIDLWRGGQTIAALTAVLPLSRFLTWSIGVSFGCVAVSIGIFFLRGKLDRPPSTIVMQLLPETRLEYAVFVALCLLIGLVEEFLFRGFAFFTLTGLLHSKIPAVAIVTVFFAAQHGIQDAIGIARAFVLGILLVIPVLVTGSLLPSVIAHAIIDAFTGVYGRSLLKCFGVNCRDESGAGA
jgi:membrane protease YdiL (CAAX protease family)